MKYCQAKEFLQSRHQATASQILEGKQNFSLDPIRALCKELGDPQKSLSTVHVAGTNGKGSFVAYLESIMTQAGLMVGSFTSPYLEDYKETIRIQTKEIEEDLFGQCAAQVKEAVARLEEKGEPSPSEYECLMAISLLAFVQSHCDLVIVEACLGGKDDVTNIIEPPLLTVLMPVGMDHMEVLGQTPQQIAESELEILKAGSPLLVAVQTPVVSQQVETVIQQKGNPWIQTREVQIHSLQNGCTFDYKTYKDIHLSMRPSIQAQNASVALEAALFLQRKYPSIDESAIREGLEKTVWPGRFEVLEEKRPVIVDGAHNIDGIRALISGLDECYPDVDFDFYVGMFKDKDIQSMMQEIDKKAKRIYCFPLGKERETSSDELASVVSQAQACDSFDQAMRQGASHRGICICGSLSVIPLAKSYFNKR